MSNLVEAATDYMPRIPADAGDLLRAFATGVSRKQLERELVAHGQKKETAQRQLQRWGIVLKGKGGTQRRGPARAPGGTIRRETREKLTAIILARHFPVRITATGIICSGSKPEKRDCRQRTIKVEPISYEELRDLLAFAAAAEQSLDWPHEEEAACNVFNGWYFEEPPESIEIDGQTFELPYNDTLDYEQAVFTVEKVARGRGRSAA
jgi:hypothetical protein